MLVYEGILNAGLVDFKTKTEDILELFDEDILKELDLQSKENSDLSLSNKENSQEEKDN